ncbi:MAG: hypothetical protein HAW66_07465 [Shewanella sp.]|nr:hypothetical protein [Shewanella sp.]
MQALTHTSPTTQSETLGLKRRKFDEDNLKYGSFADRCCAGDSQKYALTKKGFANEQGEIIDDSVKFQRFWHVYDDKGDYRSLQVTDMGQVSLEQWLITPTDNALTPFFAHDAREQFKTNYLTIYEIPTENVKQKALIDACFKIETLFPTFAEVAQELHKELPPEVVKALAANHQTCPVEEHGLKRSRIMCESSGLPIQFPFDVHHRALVQDTISIPSLDKWEAINDRCEDTTLDKVLTTKLRNTGFAEASPQVFIGFMNKKMANNILKKHLFMEDGAASHLLHGAHSHLWQVLALSKQGVLDQDLLNSVVDEDLWDALFDSDAQLFPTTIQIDHSDDERTEYYKNIGRVMTGIAPEHIHALFLEKKLSASIERIVKTGTLPQQEEMIRLFGLKPAVSATLLQLKQLKQEMITLESCIIDTQYTALKKIGVKRIAILDKFYEENDTYVARARHYIQEGYDVTVSRSQLNWLNGFIKDGKPVDKLVFNDLNTFNKWYATLTNKTLCFSVDKKLVPFTRNKSETIPMTKLDEKETSADHTIDSSHIM